MLRFPRLPLTLSSSSYSLYTRSLSHSGSQHRRFHLYTVTVFVAPGHLWAYLYASNRISHRSRRSGSRTRASSRIRRERQEMQILNSIALLDPRSHWQRSWRGWRTKSVSTSSSHLRDLLAHPVEVLPRDLGIVSARERSSRYSVVLGWKFTLLSADSLPFAIWCVAGILMADVVVAEEIAIPMAQEI